MKKKLIALVLALSACFSMTACDVVKDKLSGLPIIGGLINKDSSTEDPAEEYDLDGAKKLLESRVKTTNAESREEYAVPASFQLLGVTYTVEWSVDVDTVKIEKDGDEVYVNVYEASLAMEDTPFVLTAKITAPDGTSIETKMNRIVPKLERYVPAKITEKPVEGTAYKFNVYQAKNKNEVYVNGKMKNTYYFDTYTEYANGIDFYVEYVEGSTTEFYLYHEIESEDGATEKEYINVIASGKYVNAVYGNPDPDLFSAYKDYQGTLKTPFYFHDEWKTIATDLNGSTYYLGCDGTYDTVEPQNGTGPDYFKGYLVEEVDRLTVDAEDKLAHEVTTLTLAPAYLAGGESASVVTHGSRYPDVKISWTADSEAVSLKRTVLSFNDTDTSASVTLTATLTIGDKTETKDVSFTVVPNTTEDILAAAAAFNSGEAFGNKVELTGVIVSIDDEYDPTYDNVTFTMLVGDKRVEGYHMKGDGADVLAPGFTVTCSGKFMNYGGKLEFSSGRIESYEVGEAPELPEAPTGAEAILNALYALQDGETMTGEFTLTGKITALDNYNNPTIVVEGFENMPVYCYRLSVENKVGDTITVTAKTMKNYGGTYEFMDCTLVSSGNEGGNEDEEAITDAEQILTSLYALADGESLTGPFILTGTITALDSYNNPTITVKGFEDKPVYCYRLVVSNVVGDVITVKAASMKNYMGTYEFMDCTLVTDAEGGEGEGETPTPPAISSDLQENVAYNVYMTVQNGVTYYMTGAMAGNYLATSYEPADAIEVYAEKADAGYKFYFNAEAKTYIIIDSSSTKVSLSTDAATATVFSYNTEIGYWYANVAGADYYLGTYNAYTTIGTSETSYINANNAGVSQFVATFVPATEVAPLTDTQKIAYEAESVTLTDAVEGERTLSLMVAGKVFTNVTVDWAVTEGTEIASIAEGKLVITNPTAATTVKVVATIKSNNASETKEFTVTVTPATDDGVSKVIATFTFGDNGTNTEHVDGSDIGASKDFSADGYTLALTNASKVYAGAFDLQHNSCLKMGTSSVVGTFTFTVEENVNKVVIYAAKYKAKNSKLTINGGTEITLSSSSNDGAYEAIEIDTSVTKTITVATVSSNCRVMINTIEFWS